MSGPRIAPFFEVCHDRSLAVSEGLDEALFTEGRELFVFLHGGYSMGYWWKRGDVIVCSREVSVTANVVLVPRGYGWPRLGRQNGYGDLSGDAGEPCRLDRWLVAGNIMYVCRRDDSGEWREVCLGDSLESPVEQDAFSWDKAVQRPKRFPVSGWRRPTPSVGERQLSLFTRPGLAA